MPEDDRIPISEFDEAPQLDNNDVIPVLHPINNVLTTVKTKLTALGTHLLKVMQFASDLTTDNKTVIGAINEVKAGNVSTLAGLTDTNITTPQNKQGLVYNSTNNKWENQDIASDFEITKSFTSTPIATLSDGAENVPMKSLICEIVPKETGTGTKSPSNPYVISGSDEVVIMHTGKNLFPQASISGTKNETVDFSLPLGEYTISALVTSSDTDGTQSLILFRFKDNTTASVRINRGTRQSGNVTISKELESIDFYAGYNSSQSSGDTFTYSDIQIEEGTTATDYEPYTATTETITLPSTVYGGEVDVVSGQGSDKCKQFSFNEAQYLGKYGADNANLYYVDIPDYATDVIKTYVSTYAGVDVVLLSNLFVKNSEPDAVRMLDNQIRTQAGDVPTKFYFRADQFADLSALNAFLAVTPLQVVAELATPTPISTTPTTIKTKGGTESIWSDTGDVSGEYYTEQADDIVDLHNAIDAEKETILIGTLEAGETEITFTSDKITTTATYDFYTDTFGVNPTGVTVSAGSIVLTFDEQQADVGVKVVIK